MISADVKNNVKQEIKELVAGSYNFYKKCLQIQCKKGMYFSFNFGWYFIKLDQDC